MDKIVEDDELGRLIVRVNSRARSLVFRTKSDAVYVSVPPGTTLKEVQQAIEEVAAETLPTGYGYEFSGMTREEQSSSSGTTAIIFMLCLVFVYLSLIHISEPTRP